MIHEAQVPLARENGQARPLPIGNTEPYFEFGQSQNVQPGMIGINRASLTID